MSVLELQPLIDVDVHARMTTELDVISTVIQIIRCKWSSETVAHFVNFIWTFLFSLILAHHLLPPPENTGHNLRPLSHNFTLHTPVTKQNYLHRMLFLDMYWVLLITLTLYYISPISIF